MSMDYRRLYRRYYRDVWNPAGHSVRIKKYTSIYNRTILTLTYPSSCMTHVTFRILPVIFAAIVSIWLRTSNPPTLWKCKIYIQSYILRGWASSGDKIWFWTHVKIKPNHRVRVQHSVRNYTIHVKYLLIWSHLTQKAENYKTSNKKKNRSPWCLHVHI